MTQQLPLLPPRAPDHGERVLKLTVAYDGGDFRGFAPQRGARTVHGVLTETLEMVLQREIDLVGAGRTDAVSPGQVVSCAVAGIDLDPARAGRGELRLSKRVWHGRSSLASTPASRRGGGPTFTVVNRRPTRSGEPRGGCLSRST